MMETLHAVIVDDEVLSCRGLEALLKEYFPEVRIDACCTDIPDARQVLSAAKPDLLFLDVELPPYGNAFDLLQDLYLPATAIIFITGYSRYAIEAFRVNAMDYIVKPIDIDELRAAIEKVKELRKLKQVAMLQNNLQHFLNSLNSGSEPPEARLMLKTYSGYQIFNTSQIVFCRGHKSHTEFHLIDGRSFEASGTLESFQEKLPDYFTIVKRSYLVNLMQVLQIVDNTGPSGGGRLLLPNNVQVEFSRRMRDIVLNKLKSISISQG